MSGYENLNREAFDKAEKLLCENGYLTINPHTTICDRAANPDNKNYLANDIFHLNKCDMLAVLPNWNESIGSRIKVGFAIACKIPIICADTLKPLNLNLEFKIS